MDALKCTAEEFRQRWCDGDVVVGKKWQPLFCFGSAVRLKDAPMHEQRCLLSPQSPPQHGV